MQLRFILINMNNFGFMIQFLSWKKKKKTGSESVQLKAGSDWTRSKRLSPVLGQGGSNSDPNLGSYRFDVTLTGSMEIRSVPWNLDRFNLNSTWFHGN